MKYTFGESFGYGPKNTDYSITFDIDLTDEEAEIIRAFLKENGDCDYAYLEFEHPGLFDLINDTANDAVVEEINRHRRRKLDFFDIDWTALSFDFYWPEELLK